MEVVFERYTMQLDNYFQGRTETFDSAEVLTSTENNYIVTEPENYLYV